MILYTKAILEKVIKPNNDNIYILAVHPGAVNTEMQNQWTDVSPVNGHSASCTHHLWYSPLFS